MSRLINETTQKGVVKVPGRRERNMLEKQDRIFAAAARLLAEHGFAAVTTQQISEAADVAAGTLFRYAATKGELLVMVYNAEFAAAVEEGRRAAEDQTDLTAALITALAPVLERSRSHPENLAAYQRELMFGSPEEKFRAEGLAVVAGLEAWIAARLESAGVVRRESGAEAHDGARVAAGAIFAALHLSIARLHTGAHAGFDPLADLSLQIRQIVVGYLALDS